MHLPGRRVVIGTVALFSVAIALFAAAVLIPIWSARHRTASLLGCVESFHPSVTSEAQTLACLQPLLRYEDSSIKRSGDDQIANVDYVFYNSPEVPWNILQAIPLTRHLVPPWTLFAVTLDYQSGVLSSVHINQMQGDNPNMLHPNSLPTWISSSHFEQEKPVGAHASNFNGHGAEPRSPVELGANGKPTGSTWLDERTTPNPSRDTLNFRLHCLPSWRMCRDDRANLP